MNDPASDPAETVVKGVPVSNGIGIGPLFVFAEGFPLDAPAYRLQPSAVAPELERLRRAVAAAREELRHVREEAARTVGEAEARIFLVHDQILDDPTLHDQIERLIRDDQINAEAAVSGVIRRYGEAFAKLEDPLARDRVIDVRDVGRRILLHLAPVERGDGDPRSGPAEKYVLVTRELFPSDAARLPRERLAAIVTESGGKASHAAILARALGIPAVTGVRDIGRLVELAGVTAVVDGREGLVVIRPGAETLQRYERRGAAFQRLREALDAEPALPAVTRDGAEIEILVNVENEDEVMPQDLGAIKGIGLYRTEFVYMNRRSFPSEDEQFEVYRSVLERAGPREVTFRTLDIGGDKRLPYFRIGEEDNPALGWRGFRICDEWPDLFIAQVRALLRASVAGNARILLPMITNVEEVRRAVAILLDVRADLARRRVPCAQKVPIGVMVEVPATAVHAEALLREVDFLSIGSNDLIQYLLAVDRNNARVAELSQPLHPAVLRVLHSVIQAGRRAKKPVSLCGEMAGSFYCTMVLVGLGLRRFSMARHYVPGVGRLVQALTVEEAEVVARRALSFATVGEVRSFVMARTREIFRSIGVPLEDAIAD